MTWLNPFFGWIHFSNWICQTWVLNKDPTVWLNGAARLIGLHHPLDGVTNPEYKLLHFLQLIKFFCKEKKALAFSRDRCWDLALCLQLILFHFEFGKVIIRQTRNPQKFYNTGPREFEKLREVALVNLNPQVLSKMHRSKCENIFFVFMFENFLIYFKLFQLVTNDTKLSRRNSHHLTISWCVSYWKCLY